MTSPFTLDPIEAKTKGELNRLRRDGFTPVSLQHKGMTTLHYQQATQPLNDFLRQSGEAALLDLWIVAENRSQRAIVQSVQRDPLTGRLLQVTFQQLGHDDTLKTHVSLQFVGEPQSVQRNEAMLQHQLDHLDIECAQADLPNHIAVNIAHLALGEVMRVSDLPLNSRYKILTAADTVLASLVRPRGSIEATEAVPASA